jgi:hypothetical protein
MNPKTVGELIAVLSRLPKETPLPTVDFGGNDPEWLILIDNAGNSKKVDVRAEKARLEVRV